MNEVFLNAPSQDDLDFQGFFDGQQEIVPDGTVLEGVVSKGFNGISERDGALVCYVFVRATTAGKYNGYSFRYNAKIFDADPAKRDMACRNLSVIDFQAGLPLCKGRLGATTDNMNEYWSDKAHVKFKVGLTVLNDGREMNFIRGFAYWREKAIDGGAGKKAIQQTQPKPSSDFDDDIEF